MTEPALVLPEHDAGAPTGARTPDRHHRQLRMVWWLAAAVLGFAQAWTSRHAMNPDGVTYLDIGDACARGDWSAATNAYFSSLYPCLIGVTLAATGTAGAREFTMVHVVNFAIYLFALGCFEFFLRSLVRLYREPKGRPYAACLPVWLWLVLGYSLFIWASLQLITTTIVTPDMLVAAIAYVAGAMLLRMRMGKRRPGTFIGFGAILGVGFLAKAAMLPLAVAFLAGSVAAVGKVGRALPRVTVAAVAFALVVAPYVVALSVSERHLTVGDTGKLNYAWFVNNVTPNVHWLGGPPGNGTPLHPPRVASRSPVIYEFGTPISGTYPLWYDPSYWHQGVRLRFDPIRQFKLLLGYSGAYLSMTGVILVALLAHWYAAGRRSITRAGLAEYACILLPAVAGLTMYGLVYMEARYVASFIVLLSLGVFAAVRIPFEEPALRMVRAAPGALATVLIAGFAYQLLGTGPDVVRGLVGRGRQADPHVQVAAALRQDGVLPGDHVAVIGDGLVAYWARLARVRLVAELPSVDAAVYWAGDSTLQRRVLRTLAAMGARVVVAQDVPTWAFTGGWQRVGSSGFAMRSLRPSSPR